MGNVISLYPKLVNKRLAYWTKQYSAADSLTLLAEVETFKKERAEKKELLDDTIPRGIALFRVLHSKAITEEFRYLAKTYMMYLEAELNKRYYKFNYTPDQGA